MVEMLNTRLVGHLDCARGFITPGAALQTGAATIEARAEQKRQFSPLI